MRIIKKYPNRRLYDTTESRYVTLGDIRRLVLNQEPFGVIDKKTDENITRAILVQVIADQEQLGPSVLSTDFLSQLVRASGSVPAQDVMRCLEESLARFLERQRDGGARSTPIGEPLEAVAMHVTPAATERNPGS
jgi:polyhydroxyalkanoate synthesis repressor PhaR